MAAPLFVLLLPALLQMLAMFVDEFVYHRKRGLPLWERLGHPIDTLSTALCYAWLVAVPATRSYALGVYVGLCALSCLVITKDEFVHSRLCEPTEHWLHALLFVLHPIVFLGFGLIWIEGSAEWLLKTELGLTLGLFAYQLVYWSPLWQRIARQSRT